MRPLAALLLSVVAATSALADDAPDKAIKNAVEKALVRIEAGVVNYPKHRGCFSCHHQAMAVLSLTAAQKRGFSVDANLLKNVLDFSVKTFRNKPLIRKGQGVGGDSTSVVYALHTFAAVDRPYDETTAALVEYLLVKQRKEGYWPVPADRPPTMSGRFANTGLALFVLKKYAPPEEDADLQKRIAAAFDKGRDWLLNNKPATTEDMVFHLKGLVYAGVEEKTIVQTRDALLKEQHDDGSWAQLESMAGDAYATGTVLTALRQAGLDVTHGAYQKGIRYLLDTQREDGAWVVQTRSRPIQIYFDNGDAGGRSQFISFAATGWAVMALLEILPPSTPK